MMTNVCTQDGARCGAHLTKLGEVEHMELAHGGCPAISRHVVGVELDVWDAHALDECAIHLQLLQLFKGNLC